MALSEETVVDQVTVEELGNINIRTVTRVLRDGEVIAESYHRRVLTPGEDVEGMDTRVVAIAGVTWTKDVIDAYRARLVVELRRSMRGL